MHSYVSAADMSDSDSRSHKSHVELEHWHSNNDYRYEHEYHYAGLYIGYHDIGGGQYCLTFFEMLSHDADDNERPNAGSQHLHNKSRDAAITKRRITLQ